MPLYEYVCIGCGAMTEKRIPVEERDNPFLCGLCSGHLKRRLASPEQIWLTVGRAKKTTYPPSELNARGDID